MLPVGCCAHPPQPDPLVWRCDLLLPILLLVDEVGIVLETKVLLCFHCLRLLLVVDKRLDVSIPTGGCDNDRRDDELMEGETALLRMTGIVAITVAAFRRTTGRCEEDDDTEGGAVVGRCADACGGFEAGGSLQRIEKIRAISLVGETGQDTLHLPFHDRRLDFLGGHLGHSAGILRLIADERHIARQLIRPCDILVVAATVTVTRFARQIQIVSRLRTRRFPLQDRLFFHGAILLTGGLREAESFLHH